MEGSGETHVVGWVTKFVKVFFMEVRECLGLPCGCIDIGGEDIG